MASGSSQFVVSMSYSLVLVDFFQSRALLLSLSELSGPGLESCVFVTADSPGLLVLFWDLHLPKSLCFTAGAILVIHRVQTLMAVCGASAATLVWRRVPALSPPANEGHLSFRVEVSDATASVSGLLLTMSDTQCDLWILLSCNCFLSMILNCFWHDDDQTRRRRQPPPSSSTSVSIVVHYILDLESSHHTPLYW